MVQSTWFRHTQHHTTMGRAKSGNSLIPVRGASGKNHKKMMRLMMMMMMMMMMMIMIMIMMMMMMMMMMMIMMMVAGPRAVHGSAEDSSVYSDKMPYSC